MWVSDGAGARRPTGSKARRRAWLRRGGALAHPWPRTEPGRVGPAPAAGPHPRLSSPAMARRAPTPSSQPCFRSRAPSSRREARVGGNRQRALGVFSGSRGRVPVAVGGCCFGGRGWCGVGSGRARAGRPWWAGGRRAGGRRRQAARERPGAGAVAAVLVSIVVSIPACHAGDRGSIPRRGGNTPSFGGWRRSLSCRLSPKGPSSPPSALRPPPSSEALDASACPACTPSTASSPSALPPRRALSCHGRARASSGPHKLSMTLRPAQSGCRRRLLASRRKAALMHSGIGAQRPGRAGGG